MAVYTTIDNPELYFQCKIYTGDGNTGRSITFDNTDTSMQPDLAWFKNRDDTDHFGLVDSVRGVTKRVSSNDSFVEQTDANNISAFNSNGFSISASGIDNMTNTSGEKYVFWCWKAGSSNTAVSASGTGDGCINACTHRANTTSKFSIIKYTGRNDEISNGQHTRVTHGLGTKPDFLIIKDLDGAQNWCTTRGSSNDNHNRLDTTAVANGSLFTGNQLNSTTTYFQVGNETMVNYNIRDFVAYVWTSVQGFSKMGGSYEGNGANHFIYTGFSPAWVIIKKIDDTHDWHIFDNKRDAFNPRDSWLEANTSNAEATSSNYVVDFLSNGFKTGSGSGLNGSGETFIYMCFAEAPFVNSKGVPCNAR